jgi:hypothetical protein
MRIIIALTCFGLNSFYLIIGVWCCLSFFVVSCIVSLVACFRLDEMLRFEHHLAAKFGTRFAAFSVYVIFAMGG